MALSIFYGTDREALQIYCRNIAQQNHNTVLIVPEQFSLSGETSFLDLQGQGTVVTSFRRFAYQLFEQRGISGEYVGGAAKLILMEQSLQRCASRLTVYKNCIDKRGFADTLCKTVGELKHAQITPNMLNEKKDLLTDQPYLQEKLTDLSLIYQNYIELLEQVGQDSDDDLTRLSHVLSKTSHDSELENLTLVLYYFSGFTAQERTLISVLEGRCKQIHIGFITEAHTKQVDTKLCFLSTIHNIEAFAGLQPAFVKVTGGTGGNQELSFLSSQFFSYPSRKWEGEVDRVKIFCGDNPYQEMELVAAELTRLCREEGMRYRDFAVVARDLSGYEDVRERVFSIFGIPYFTDQKEKIATHPLVSFLLSIRDIFTYRWNYESVFHYVKSYFSPLSRELGDKLENFALAYGVSGSIWTNQEQWQTKLDRAATEETLDLIEIQAAKDQVVTPLVHLYERVKGKKSYKEHAHALFLFLEEIGMYEKLVEKTEEFRLAGQQQLAEEYRQLWNSLLHVLDQVVALCGEDTGSFSKFMDLMEEGFEACSVGTAPPSLDAVTVSSADRFVGEGVRCLFVIGVNEGEFPAGGLRSGLLDGVERDVLEAVGLETATSRQKSAYMEQEIIYKIISMARERLLFTYRRADMDQTAKTASSVIWRVKELFPRLNIQSQLPVVSAPGYTFSKMAQQPGRYRQAKDWFLKQPVWADRIHMLEQVGDRQQVNLSEETIKALYRNGIQVSVSKLEKFNRCPFSFHATYHLRAKERRQYRLGAPDTGSFLHTVLEQCATLIDESKSLSWQTITQEECGVLVERVVTDSASTWFGGLLVSSPRYVYLTSRLKRLLTKNLYYISLHFKNGLFRPLGYELEFRDGGDLPPVRIKTMDGKSVTLTGKVDRADVYQTPDGSWIRIIDYKSGPKELQLNDVYYGLHLQLVTYLDAMCHKDQPAGVFYFNVTDPYTRTTTALDGTELLDTLRKNYKMKGLVLAEQPVLYAMDQDCDGSSDLIPAYVKKEGQPGGSVATAQEFSLLRKQVKACLQQLSTGIGQGRVDVMPVKTKREFACTYCEFSSLCGYEGKTGSCRKLTDYSKDELMKRMEESNG